MRDLRQKPDLSFGGVSVLLAGDLKQTARVVQSRNIRTETVEASIVSWKLWGEFRKVILTTPHRHNLDPDYSSYLDRIGHGTASDAIIYRRTYPSAQWRTFQAPHHQSHQRNRKSVQRSSTKHDWGGTFHFSRYKVTKNFPTWLHRNSWRS
jgi:hypothetical protein